MKGQRLAPLALIGGIACSNLWMSFNLPAAIAQQQICYSAKTQPELNQCTRRNAEAADRKLNQVYQQVQTRRGTQSDKLLVEAEAAWIKYRDASCKFSASRHEGGSLAPADYNICLERLTKQRTQELESYLQEGS